MKRIKKDKIEIRKDNLFLRKDYNKDALERYKEMFESEKSNPILVSDIDGKYILVDGFHRVKASPDKNKFIEANIEKIPEDELRSRAIQENLKHGVPLSKEERNEIVKKLYVNDSKTIKEISIIIKLSERQTYRMLESDIMSNTNILIPKEWLNGELTHEQISKQYNITRARVTQIISEFKQKIFELYQTGLTIEEIQKQILKDNKIEPTKEKIEEILIGLKLNEQLVKLPKLINDDCLKGLDKIPDKCIDLIYVDPPYCILDKKKAEWDVFKSEKDYWNFTEKWLDKLIPKLKDTGRLFISFSQEKMWELKKLMDKYDLKLGNCIIWNYRNNIKPQDNKRFKFTYEPIFHYYNKNAKALIDYDEYGEERLDVWTIATPQSNYNEDKKEHPTQKPKELLRRIIKTTTNEKDLILDCFAGSGTTGIIARELKRNFILLEKDKEYFKLIEEKING